MPITWTPSSPTAPIVYHRGTAATGVNNVELKSPNTSLSRTLLLMPGVYDLKLYAKSPPQPPSNSCAITDQKNYYTMNYFRTDHPNTPSYGNPAPTALLGTSDTVENDILTKAMNYTCNPYNVFSSASEQHLCFLVPRTGFWDVGVYSRDSGAVHVDEISVTLLTSNITNTDTWPVMDPTTWDPRKTPGPQAALASNPKCNNRISIVLGGVVGWPSYTTFSRASGRITVTQSKYL